MTESNAEPNELRIREAVRALIIDCDERVLLVRFQFSQATFWALPGGGVDEGEDPIDALRRELHEEVGLTDVEIGPHVWDRTVHRRFDPAQGRGAWDGQHERVHLVRVDRCEPRPTMTWEQLHAEQVHELRWWTLDELRRSEATFAPERLADHVAAILDGGPPPAPIDAGV